MDRLLSEREKVNAELKEAIDEPTEQPGHRLGRLAVGPVEAGHGENPELQSPQSAPP
jgi:hypothetical protein